MFRKQYHQANDNIETNKELMEKLLIKAKNPQLLIKARKKRKHTLIAAAASFCIVCASAAVVPELVHYQKSDGNGVLFESQTENTTPMPSTTDAAKNVQTPKATKVPVATDTPASANAPVRSAVPNAEKSSSLSSAQKESSPVKTQKPSVSNQNQYDNTQKPSGEITAKSNDEYTQPREINEYILNAEDKSGLKADEQAVSKNIFEGNTEYTSEPVRETDIAENAENDLGELNREQKIEKLVEQVVLGINSVQEGVDMPYGGAIFKEDYDTDGNLEEWTRKKYTDYMNIHFMNNLILPNGMSDNTSESMMFFTDSSTGEPLNAHWSFSYTGDDKTVLIITRSDDISVQSYLNSDLIKSDILGTRAVVFEQEGGYICYLTHGSVSFTVRTKGLTKDEFSALLISIVKEGEDNL